MLMLYCLSSEDNNASTEVSNDTNTEARQTNESRFRSVTELSTRGEELAYLPDIDMVCFT